MRDHVYQTPIQDMTDLRQCLVDTWSGFLQSIVDDAIDEWPKRLQAQVDERGGGILNTCCNTGTLLPKTRDSFLFVQR